MGFLNKIFGKTTDSSTKQTPSSAATHAQARTSQPSSKAGAPSQTRQRAQSTPRPSSSTAAKSSGLGQSGVTAQSAESKPTMNGASAVSSTPTPTPATATAAPEPVSDDQAQALREAFSKVEDRISVPESPMMPPKQDISRTEDPAALVDVKAPRNKQELFEELQKNYREVVGLIRKVDNHLDEQNQRSVRMMQIAERMDSLSGAIEQAGAVPQKIDELKSTIESALRTTEQGTAERTERVRQAVEEVGTALVASSDQQSKLTHTMAEFRQTIGDLSEATGQSSSAMRTLMDSVIERDKAFAEELRVTRSRVIIAVGILGAVSLSAVVVAILAITQG